MQLISEQKIIIVPKWKVRLMTQKEITCGLNKENFPINLHGETEGELMCYIFTMKLSLPSRCHSI